VKRTIGISRHRGEVNFKMDPKELDGYIWARFDWFTAVTSGGLLWIGKCLSRIRGGNFIEKLGGR